MAETGGVTIRQSYHPFVPTILSSRTIGSETSGIGEPLPGANRTKDDIRLTCAVAVNVPSRLFVTVVGRSCAIPFESTEQITASFAFIPGAGVNVTLTVIGELRVWIGAPFESNASTSMTRMG